MDLKYILGLLLAVSFNANACYVVNGYVQCPPQPVVVMPAPAPIIIPPQAPYIPAPLPNTGIIVK